MSGKIETHAKLTHGHPLPDHLNPAKQPNGALKNDHEAGPSGKAQPKAEAVPTPNPAHAPGQEAPVSLNTPAHAPGRGDGDISSELGAPRFDLRLPPSPPDSPLPAWMEGRSPRGSGLPESRGSASPALSDLSLANHAGLTLGDLLDRPFTPSPGGSPHASPTAAQTGVPLHPDPGAHPERSRGASGATSEGLDEILGLMGGGNFKNWDDIRTGLNRNEDMDARLDKIPFIASHLDPDKQSPDHEKLNWTKLPDTGHPMFSDFVITQNPQFYSFRRPEQRSAPLAGQPPQAPDAAPDQARARLDRSHSLPADFRVGSDTVAPLALMIPEGNPGPGGADPIRNGTGGHGVNGAPHREEIVPASGNGEPPQGPRHQEHSGPVDSRLDDLMRENARLQKKVKDITAKAIAGGVAAAGVGLVAGMLIEGGSGDPPAGAPGNV